MQAIADSIEDGLRKKGERPFGIEGVTQGRWALIDYVDVVVHIFLDSVRSFYDLEGLWAEAPVTEVKDKAAALLKGASEPKAKAAAVKAPKKAAVAKAAKKPAVKKAPKKTSAAKAPEKAVAAKAAKKPAVKKAPKKTVAPKAPKKAAVTKAKTVAGKKKKSE